MAPSSTKASNWIAGSIYIWVLLDLTPDLWYKKKYILPGGFIPSPKKPKDLDLFMYTGLHDLLALQRDGICIWDCSMGCVFTLHLFFFLGTADGPGLAAFHGVTLGTGVRSDLGMLSVKVVLSMLIQPLLTQVLCETESVARNGIQVGH